MREYSFTTNDKRYKRVDRRKALKAFTEGKNIIIMPCNLRPVHPFLLPEINYDYMVSHYNYVDTTPEGVFSEICELNEYYNCNAETGKYLAYYVE